MNLQKGLILALLLLAVGFACQQKKSKAQEKVTFKMEGNPLVRHIGAADPDVHVWDGVVWMYCSQDHQRQEGDKGNYDHMDGYHAFSSTDMIHWTDHGEVLHTRDIPWAHGGWLFAPGAAHKNGKYYIYFPVKDKEKKWKVGVAVSDAPQGPFEVMDKPLEGFNHIDPMCFIDDDGEAYLYNNKNVVAKLKPNMIEVAEKPRKIVYAPEEIVKDTLRSCLEGSYMHKKDGIYYYSYTNWKNPEIQGYYAMGSNPYGPFEWKGALGPAPNDGAQDHHSIIEFKGQWYYFYHIGGKEFIPEGWNGYRRIACYDKLYYNEDGTIQMIKHTKGKSN